VTVVDHLAGGLAGITKTRTEADIVKTTFKQLKHHRTCDTTAAGRLLVVGAELFLENAVLETKLLLLSQGDRILGLFLTTRTNTVLAWWKIAALQRLGWAEK
jgi:hypothetical protein